MFAPCRSEYLTRHSAVLLVLLVAALGSGIASCTNEVAGNHSEKSGAFAQDTTHDMTIEEALEKHTEDLLGIGGVEGVAQGQCDDQPCITVYVFKKEAKVEQAIPDTLEGYPVSLVETGGIEMRSTNEDSSRS